MAFMDFLNQLFSGMKNRGSGKPRPAVKTLTLNDIDFDRFDTYAHALEPFNRFLDVGARPLELEADYPYLVSDACLSDIRNDLELTAQLPDHRGTNETRRKHQPEARLLWGYTRSFTA
jgi:hypothetical protein